MQSQFIEYVFVNNDPIVKFDILGLSGNLSECHICGPDVTDWLINQMNQNRDHWVIKTKREKAWPNFVPFFNVGWNSAFLKNFTDLVRENGPWDFKNSVSFATKSCPSDNGCKRTVTLCGICLDYDVPGNIHYGYVGRAALLRRWFLLRAAAGVQDGGIDPSHDVAAIKIGMDILDAYGLLNVEKGGLCWTLRIRRNQLNFGQADCAKRCSPCNEELKEPQWIGW
jgi:hypothetical protein